MKRRKSVVVVFLLAAAMMLSVGYATLTDKLSITGGLETDPTTAMNDFDADVYFSGTSIVQDDTGNKAVSQILDGGDDAKIEALHFTVKDQVVKAKFTIANDSVDFAASIEVNAATGEDEDRDGISVENNAEHDPIFSVEWSWEEEGSNHDTAEIQPGKTKDLWVTITLDETPQENHEATFTVSYTATAVEATTATPGAE